MGDLSLFSGHSSGDPFVYGMGSGVLHGHAGFGAVALASHWGKKLGTLFVSSHGVVLPRGPRNKLRPK